MIPGKQRIPKNISTATTDLYTGRLSLLYETENPVTMYNAYYEGSNDSYISFTQGFKENVDIHVTYDGTGKRRLQVNGKRCLYCERQKYYFLLL